MLELMRDYIEPEARSALRDKAPSPKLDALLRQLADMTPDPDAFAKWNEMTLASMSPQTYAVGCKNCHAAYLRLYKRRHRAETYEIHVP